jgi:hypothetical protein
MIHTGIKIDVLREWAPWKRYMKRLGNRAGLGHASVGDNSRNNSMEVHVILHSCDHLGQKRK